MGQKDSGDYARLWHYLIECWRQSESEDTSWRDHGESRMKTLKPCYCPMCIKASYEGCMRKDEKEYEIEVCECGTIVNPNFVTHYCKLRNTTVLPTEE